jgi:hypothetical protein
MDRPMTEAFSAVQLISDQLARLRRRQLEEDVPGMGNTFYERGWSEEFTELQKLIYGAIPAVGLAIGYALLEEGSSVECASYEKGRRDAFDYVARNEESSTSELLRGIAVSPQYPGKKEIGQ